MALAFGSKPKYSSLYNYIDNDTLKQNNLAPLPPLGEGGLGGLGAMFTTEHNNQPVLKT